LTTTSVVRGVLQNGGEDKDDDDCNCVVGTVGDGDGWDEADENPLNDDYEDNFVEGGTTTVEAVEDVDGDGIGGGPSIATTKTSTTTMNMTKKNCGGSVLDVAWLAWHGLVGTAPLSRLGTAPSARLGMVWSARHGSANLKKSTGSKRSLLGLNGVAGCVRQCFRPGET
jgi:hypothetical protein